MLILKGIMHVFTLESLDSMLEILKKRNITSPNIEIEGIHVTFFDTGETVHDDFKNLTLFLLDAILLVETYDSNGWFVDFSAPIHMSCNKDWFEK
jgi:hypothetical protein